MRPKYLRLGVVANLVYVSAVASGILTGGLIIPVTLAIVGIDAALVIGNRRARKGPG